MEYNDDDVPPPVILPGLNNNNNNDFNIHLLDQDVIVVDEMIDESGSVLPFQQLNSLLMM